MSKHGENIYKRKDNRWEGRYIKGYDYAGKPKFGYVYAKTYGDVRARLSLAKCDRLDTGDVSKKTLADFCDDWLKLKRSTVKESTYIKYRVTIEKHLKPAFGNRLPRNLNTISIEDYSFELLNREKPLSPKTVKDILVVLNAILQYCRKDPKTAMPPMEIVYPKEPKKEMRVLTGDEQKRLIRKLLSIPNPINFGILLALLTGMRIGEVCALRWQDISLSDRTVTVDKTMQRLQTVHPVKTAKTRVLIGDAKSDASKRKIPLTNSAYELCRKMFVAIPEAYVLSGSAERYIEPRVLQYQFKKIAQSCGLDGVHFHTLRHTFATRCVEVGFEIKSLSEILGHANVNITLNRYVHSSLELKRANMEKLNAAGF